MFKSIMITIAAFAVLFACAALLIFRGSFFSPSQAIQLVTTGGDYQIDQSKASLSARQLMKQDWFWSIVDDNSPFGNDDGAEALANYRGWRRSHPGEDRSDGIRLICEKLESPLSMWITEDKNSIALDPTVSLYLIPTADRAIISIAFGQLVDDGSVNRRTKELALKAIDNEMLPALLKHWVSPKVRQRRLEIMHEVLRSAPSERS